MSPEAVDFFHPKVRRRAIERALNGERPTMIRHTYRLVIAYDGSAFAGFRRQPGQRTVESALVDALRGFVPALSGVAVAARTDRGVHALRQVVSFWSRQPLHEERVHRAIDAVAPDALCVRDLQEVPRSFHASFSAIERSYVYLYRDDGELDVERLDRMLELLRGRRCYSAFARSTPRGASTIRRLEHAAARRASPQCVRFDLTADGFLRRQVRVTVATAIREAARRADDEILLRLCEAGDRHATAQPAEPGGLYLARVGYAACTTR